VIVDTLHLDSGPATTWSRVNVAEAMPGVQTPMSWSMWESAGERAFRIAYVQLGFLPRSALSVPEDVNQRFNAIFYGQGACNMDAFRVALSAMPGTASDDAEASFFASQTAFQGRSASRLRKAVVRVWLPLYSLPLPLRLRRIRRASKAFWRTKIAELATADYDQAVAILNEAVDRAAREIGIQISISTVVAMVHGQIQQLAAAVGRPDLELSLIGGYGTTEEVDIVSDLWEVSRGQRRLETFLGEHGFHGPLEGELSSPSWREDPAPVEALMASFLRMPDDADPRSVEKARLDERVGAESTLLRSLRGRRRLQAWRSLIRGRRFIPLRVVAKAAFTQTFDVARAAVRVAGRKLAESGAIDAADDVFFLSLKELSALPADPRATIEYRRRRRHEYLNVELPLSWTGNPEPVINAEGAGANGSMGSDEPIAGLGVSPGIVEGTAHVMSDPTDPSSFEPGDILVCHATDPSWASVFLMASGVVIDIGGMLSHGAIVARELGIPCVINTGSGTQRLHTGDRIRIDGTAGAVTVLK
jgi:phosphohistidine swiveling domain-containing protein